MLTWLENDDEDADRIVIVELVVGLVVVLDEGDMILMEEAAVAGVDVVF